MRGYVVHLAQSAATRQEAWSILTGLSLIVAAGVAAAIVGFIIWRRFTRDTEPTVTPDTAFTLADLRRLHREGQLSDEEFERARAAIIAQTRAALARKDGRSRPDELNGEADSATNLEDSDKDPDDDPANPSDDPLR